MTQLQMQMNLMSEIEEIKETLKACAYELASVIGLHGAIDEGAKLEESSALRKAKEILGDELELS